MQTAALAYVGNLSKSQSDYNGATKAKESRRFLLQPGDRCPSEWTEEEAYYRQGIFGGPAAYVANRWGGAQRPLRLYHQDTVGKKASGEVSCEKLIHKNKKLSPGLFVRSSSIVICLSTAMSSCFLHKLRTLFQWGSGKRPKWKFEAWRFSQMRALIALFHKLCRLHMSHI